MPALRWLWGSAWTRALRDFHALAGSRLPEDVAARLLAGWGQEPHMTPRLLAEVVHAASRATGTILECGSGAPTVVLALAAQGRPVGIVSLEPSIGQRERVQREVRRLGLHNADVRLTPIRTRDESAWFDVDQGSLRRPVAFVVSHAAPPVCNDAETVRRFLPDAVPPGCPVYVSR
jgi:hypothetical protein